MATNRPGFGCFRVAWLVAGRWYLLPARCRTEGEATTYEGIEAMTMEAEECEGSLIVWDAEGVPDTDSL
jgi:hypothetical protein